MLNTKKENEVLTGTAVITQLVLAGIATAAYSVIFGIVLLITCLMWAWGTDVKK